MSQSTSHQLKQQAQSSKSKPDANINVPVLDKFVPMWTSEKTHIVLYGGRGGAKSWAAADYMLIKAMQLKGKIFLSTREIQKSIEKSNFATLKRRVRELGLREYFDVGASRITCLTSNTEIVFEGLRANVDSILSMDNLGVIHFEESAFVSRNSIDLVIPTATRYAGIKFIWTFNPRFADDPVYQAFLARPNERLEDFPYDWRDAAEIININWTDNPYLMQKDENGEWVNKEWHEEVAQMKRTNPEMHDHIYGGHLLRRSDALVYREGLHWEEDVGLVEFDEIPHLASRYVGVDLGFNHPTALVEVYAYERDGQKILYINDEIYRHKVPADDVPALIKESEWVQRGHRVSIDPASKQVVETVAKPKHGIHLRRARKGPMSILEGITFLYGFKVYVHPRCVNTIGEYRKYSFEIDDDTQEVLIRKPPIDEWNDALDALRYVCEELREPERRETIVGGYTKRAGRR